MTDNPCSTAALLMQAVQAAEQRVAGLIEANNAAMERERTLRREAAGLHATVEAQGHALVHERQLREAAEGKATAAANQAAHILGARIEAERQRDGMRVMLREAADQFTFYADQHEAKGTPESAEKAKVNRDWAARCRAVAGLPAAAPDTVLATTNAAEAA